VSIDRRDATWRHFHRAVQEEEKGVQRWNFGGLQLPNKLKKNKRATGGGDWAQNQDGPKRCTAGFKCLGKFQKPGIKQREKDSRDGEEGL
jgi:hypothetical protein